MSTGVECWENGAIGKKVKREHLCNSLGMESAGEWRLEQVVCYRGDVGLDLER